MTKRVYLAGPSAELDRVRYAARYLEANGFEHTVRWWDVIEAERVGRLTDDGSDPAALASAWGSNTCGIAEADWCVVLCKTGGGLSNGTREEAAFAFALFIPLAVVGDPGSSPLAGALATSPLIVRAEGLFDCVDLIRRRRYAA